MQQIILSRARTHTHTHTHRVNNNVGLKNYERTVKIPEILVALFKYCLDIISGESREY